MNLQQYSMKTVSKPEQIFLWGEVSSFQKKEVHSVLTVASPRKYNQAGENNNNWKPYQICKFCGKEYKGRKQQKFCSYKCVGKYKTAYHKSIKINKKCKLCRKFFLSYPSEHQIFCSPSCQNKYMRGNKRYNWKGGFSKGRRNYKIDKKYRMWRERVFERDDYTCQYCKLKSGCGKTVYLEAHHIKSWAEYPKLRFEISNGKTLCKDCHKIETAEEMKNKRR